VGQLRALRADFQQLVHLLLVFGKRKAHLGVVDGEDALGAAASWYSGIGMAPSDCTASMVAYSRGRLAPSTTI
jgi:hypothetical protein